MMAAISTPGLKHDQETKEREEKRLKFHQDALAALDHYQQTGLHLTAEEADAWMVKLEAGERAPLPECHD